MTQSFPKRLRLALRGCGKRTVAAYLVTISKRSRESPAGDSPRWQTVRGRRPQQQKLLGAGGNKGSAFRDIFLVTEESQINRSHDSGAGAYLVQWRVFVGASVLAAAAAEVVPLGKVKVGCDGRGR